jgi:hypothetical protein
MRQRRTRATKSERLSGQLAALPPAGCLAAWSGPVGLPSNLHESSQMLSYTDVSASCTLIATTPFLAITRCHVNTRRIAFQAAPAFQECPQAGHRIMVTCQSAFSCFQDVSAHSIAAFI